jgi:hypothetical protein
VDVTAPHPGPSAGPDPLTWRDTLSAEVRRLTEVTLTHALDQIVEVGSPMPPFVVTDGPRGLLMTRFDGDPDVAVARARLYAATVAAPRAAVAWDGWLVVGGVRQDAVVVQASERGTAGVVVAHRYRETLEGIVIVSTPVLVGPGEPVL